MRAYQDAGRNNAPASSVPSDRASEDKRKAFRDDATARATQAMNEAIRRTLKELQGSTARAEEIARELAQCATEAVLEAVPTAAEQMEWDNSGNEAQAFVDEQVSWLAPEIERHWHVQVMPAKCSASRQQPHSRPARVARPRERRAGSRRVRARAGPDDDGESEPPSDSARRRFTQSYPSGQHQPVRHHLNLHIRDAHARGPAPRTACGLAVARCAPAKGTTRYARAPECAGVHRSTGRASFISGQARDRRVPPRRHPGLKRLSITSAPAAPRSPWTFARFHQLASNLSGLARAELFLALPLQIQRECWPELEAACVAWGREELCSR